MSDWQRFDGRPSVIAFVARFLCNRYMAGCGRFGTLWRTTSSFLIRTKTREWLARCARGSSRRAFAAGSPRATCVPAGTAGREIIRGLNNARVMIVVLSANANRSRKVIKEVERAFYKRLFIIPVRTGGSGAIESA